MFPLDKNKILVIDDDSSVLEVLRTGLESMGYAVATAENADAAKKALELSVPDVILLDIGMPGMDGIRFCKELRSSPATADVPVIMVSAFNDEGTYNDAMLFGATDFVSKPFDVGELRRKIDANIAKAQVKRGKTR